MKRKMKRLLMAGIAFVTFLFSAIFAACSEIPGFSGLLGLGKTKLNGFEVKETVTVDYGTLVTVETPIVTDDDGNFYEVLSDVTDSKGGYVVVEANGFRAWDVNGYTINYVVRVDNNQAEQKTTKVNVTNTQALTVTAEYNEFEDTGANIVISPECDEQVEYTYTVKNLKTEEEVTVNTDGEQAYFVCETAGNYGVEIVAKQGERYGSFGYTVIVREAVGRTNVEHFDEQWEEIAKYLGDERVGRYNLVAGSEIGLKDRYGDDAYFLEFSSVAEWLTYYISPRYSKEHYEALAAEGYDQVTIYCYVVSKQNRSHTYAIRTMTSGFYERSPVTSYPNQWNEINMNLDLVPGKEVSRSFLAAYDYYNTQEGWFLCYNNEGPLATRDELTLYFSDMYVTKPIEITAVENAKTDYVVGDTISKDTMSEIFSSESPLRYFVNFRGERTEITGDYEFRANGEYVIEALSERKDERGSAQITVNVTDDFQASYTYIAEERTSDAVLVELKKLKASFNTVNEVTPTVSGYKVYDRYGAEYAVTDNTFAANADGAYNVEVEGTYEISGTTYKSYDIVYVDVWSQATKNKIVAVEDMYSANAWEYQSTRKQTMAVGEYTVGGVTTKAWKFTKSGDNVTLTVKPFFTKQYYQNMLDNSTSDIVLSMSVYFESGTQTGANMSTCRSFFSDYLKCTYTKDTWLMEVADLSAFVEKYDSFVAGYELQKYNVANAIKQGYDVNGSYGPMWKDYVFYAEMSSRADYVYVQDMLALPIETVSEVQIVERTGTSISMTALETTYANAGFTPAAIVKATKNGKDVTVTGATFITGESDGLYEVYVQGVKNGEPLVLKVTVDAWSETTKNTVIALEDFFIIGGYEYQSFRKETTAVGEYTVDGKTEQMLQLTSQGIECSVVVGKPLHSKKYYQQLLAKDVYYTSYVTMSWYFMDAVGKESNVTPYYDVFSNYERQGAQTKNAWLSGKITLADFVAQYDDFVALYDRTLEEYALQHDCKYGRFVDTKGVVDRQGNVIGGYLMGTKFQSNKIDYAYFTQFAIQTEMKSEQAKTLLVDRSNTSSINLETVVNGESIIEYWKSEGYEVAYEVTARYGGAKVNNGATVTITNALEDGIYYLTVTVTKGNHTGVCLNKTIDVYDSTQGLEYENFKHSDSKYAVISYIGGINKLWLWTNASLPVASALSNLTSKIQKVEFTESCNEDFDSTDYDLDSLTTPYVMNFGVCADGEKVNVTNYSGLSNVGYLEFDWNTYKAYKAIDNVYGTYGSGGYYMLTYVLPRHSVEYYELYKDSYSDLAMAYRGSLSKEGAWNDTTNQGMRYLYPTNIVDGSVTFYNHRVGTNNNQGGELQTKNVMTVQTLIDNYEAFASAMIPMQIVYQVYESTETTPTSRLYEIFFVKNA